ncbi:MAG: hypothetical protein RLP12_16020, partial [Ekhidna sp.]
KYTKQYSKRYNKLNFMSEIVIHIGTHKTGTTAIQSFFHQNRKALGDTGFWYPGYNLIDKKNHPAHLGMANALVNEHKRFSQKDAEDFFKLVAKKSKSYDYTFISAEPLYRHYLNSGNFSAHQDKQAYWESRELFIKYFLSFPLGDGCTALGSHKCGCFC